MRSAGICLQILAARVSQGVRIASPESVVSGSLRRLRRTAPPCGVAKGKKMTSKDIIKRLTEDGWFHVKTAGDHFQFRHPEKSGKVTVPPIRLRKCPQAP